MKVYLLAAIFLIACTTTQEESDSPTLRLSSGQAIAIVQESLRTKEAPETRRDSAPKTCWGYVVAAAPNWTAALNRRTGAVVSSQSYWRVLASRPASSGRLGVEWVWHVYPGSLVATVEAPC